MKTIPIAVLACTWLLGCNSAVSTVAGEPPPAARPAWAAPEVVHQVSVRDGRSGERLAFETLLDRLARAQVVFLGETHTDETTHRAELAIYAGLCERRGGRVVLALEMFERDVQEVLDLYLAGRIDEAEFLSRSRPWSNYATAYRPLVEKARSAGRPVVASNFPGPLRRRLMREGEAPLAAARAETPSHVPAELLPNTPAYWRRVDNAVRGHRGMMSGSDSEESRLLSTQSLWDNSMAEASLQALDVHLGHSVLHVNGGFHSQYWDGTVHQLRLRRPDVEVLTVALVPSIHPATEEVRGAPEADFVVYTEQRARDLNEGTYAAHVLRELQYRLHLPEAATPESPVPLLIWLGDDGLTAADGLALWRDRLGATCAIAAIEPPYRALRADLAEGGRWFWADSFSEDIEALREGVERTWAYLLRHFPLDPTRVCLAGEGAGATAVSAVTLLTWRVTADAVALHPRCYAKLKDIPLPLPEAWGDDTPPERSLSVWVCDADRTWWESELAEYEGVGLRSVLAVEQPDPWLWEAQCENALRSALDLPLREPAAGAPRRHAVADGPAASHWARLLGLRLAREEGVLFAVLQQPPSPADATSQPVDLSIHAADFAAAGLLPRCPGPFGGSTVVVLPPETSEAEVGGWLALEEADPLARSGPFHRLRVATPREGRSLPEVLEALRAAGRENVLVVPAVFCADAAAMADLQRSVRHLEDSMTIHWVPGLGAPRGG